MSREDRGPAGAEHALSRFRKWIDRLSDRRDRSVLEPQPPAERNRALRSDWQSTANARMTDDGAPPRDPETP